VGIACLDHVITNTAPLDRAGPSDLAFLDTAKYAAALTSTQAGACLMTERFESQAPSGLSVLRAQEPYRAFVDVTRPGNAGRGLLARTPSLPRRRVGRATRTSCRSRRLNGRGEQNRMYAFPHTWDVQAVAPFTLEETRAPDRASKPN
jgi:hypothetical protein